MYYSAKKNFYKAKVNFKMILWDSAGNRHLNRGITHAIMADVKMDLNPQKFLIASGKSKSLLKINSFI
jgi:hypothetical protein